MAVHACVALLTKYTLCDGLSFQKLMAGICRGRGPDDLISQPQNDNGCTVKLEIGFCGCRYQ